jgi:adenylate cyclase
VTVLFAHVGGLATLAESFDFSTLRDLMGPLFERLTACVERYGGRVERLGADTFMALFGAPVTHDNDGEMALRAAVDIRDAAASFGAERHVEGLSLHLGSIPAWSSRVRSAVGIIGTRLSGNPWMELPAWPT